MLRMPGATLPGLALLHSDFQRTAHLSAPSGRRCRAGSPVLGLLALRHASLARSRASTAHVRCSAAAISIPLPADATVGAGNGAPKAAATASPSNSNSSNSNSGGNGGAPVAAAATPAGTTAAAVAAKYPAVPLLPTPPGSGNLKDVVPYLLRLALQERHLAWRLAAAMSCMVVAKLAGISLPLVFKNAVDALSTSSSAAVMIQAALAAVLSYGALDCIRVMAKEAQSPLFAPVSQAVTRRVAYHTFSHVLGLDTRFHIDRRTGRVSRILERGTRSIGVLYRALIFTFLPTGLELAAVGALLASRFGPLLAAILAATFAAYVSWTVVMTQRATDVRKEVNHLDNQATSKAVDALLNFETVTLFNNQRLEVGLYDKLLCDLRSASLSAETLSAGLNAGQGLILAGGMAAILAAIIGSGSATGGDLVMASGLIVQLWAPLQFLGWFYRELRAALVDMEEFFQILRTSSNIKDGDSPLPPGIKSAVAAAAVAVAGACSSSSSSSTAASPGHVTTGSSLSETEERLASNGLSSSTSSGPMGHSAPSHGPEGLSVELVDVSFGYSPERQILRGVSLRVAPGESVAVVGSSGSGKSTILKLVTRLYDVWPDHNHHNHHSHQAAATASSVSNGNSNGSSNGSSNGHLHSSSSSNGSNGAGVRHFHGSERDGGSGSLVEGCSTSNDSCSSSSSSGGRPSGMYINGVDVRQLRLADLRSAIAVVPQDTALYYDSIRENIRYGRPEASDEEVEAAARAARLHDTVMALPDKYDTVVGERGLKLSGGEKQRVAIARAFLRSPRLLICDEATSALDSGTEVAIMDSLKELARGRSALFVAHRLSTVRNCDRIVVLRAGGVVEEGSHEQLMARRGEYAAMWELQASSAHPGDGQEDDGGITDSDAEADDLGQDTAAAAAAAAAAVSSTDSMDDIGGGGGAGSSFVPRSGTSVLAAAALPPPAAASAAAAAASAAAAAVRGAIREV